MVTIEKLPVDAIVSDGGVSTGSARRTKAKANRVYATERSKIPERRKERKETRFLPTQLLSRKQHQRSDTPTQHRKRPRVRESKKEACNMQRRKLP